MIEAANLPDPSGSFLRHALIRIAPRPVTGWRDDLRFFGIVYALGLVFFLLLLG